MARRGYGFVNIKGLTDEPGSEAVLKAWRDAGYPLGNHGAAHLNLEKAPSIEAWQEDVSAGEPLIAKYMKGADWRWYRFPNLAAGSEPVLHDAAAAYLGERGWPGKQIHGLEDTAHRDEISLRDVLIPGRAEHARENTNWSTLSTLPPDRG